MTKKIELVLKEAIEKINPEEEFIIKSNRLLKNFINEIKKEISKRNLKVEVFVGGSFAKETIIKKENYDIDIYLRFDKEYSEEEMIKEFDLIMSKWKNSIRVHGSRDYFQLKAEERIIFEVIPVKKISKPSEARNITDLSYSHVKYIRKNSNLKILDQIKLAKSFCQAQKVYGAESYIGGFSGYSLELLIIRYKSFEKLLRELIKIKTGEKLVVDIEKKFNNKKEVLMNLNESKLSSPIILIDPTYGQRNALAALSEETLNKFKQIAKNFLSKPSGNYFEKKEVNLKEIEIKAKKKGKEFILIETQTSKQEGDIAGSKLKKFYEYLSKEIDKFFEIKESGFNYNKKQSARYFFVVNKKKEMIFGGPLKTDEKNAKEFKKSHKSVYEKKGRLYAKEYPKNKIKDFMELWKKKNSRRIKEMYVDDLKVIKG